MADNNLDNMSQTPDKTPDDNKSDKTPDDNKSDPPPTIQVKLHSTVTVSYPDKSTQTFQFPEQREELFKIIYPGRRINPSVQVMPDGSIRVIYIDLLE